MPPAPCTPGWRPSPRPACRRTERLATETLIDLLRHGEAAGGARLRGGRNDDPLTPAGWQALERAVAACAGWDCIATSPQRRCRSFAEVLADRAGCALCVDERLREYDFGDWDGQPFDRLWADHGDAVAAFLGDPDSGAPPHGETADAFRHRVRAAWAELIKARAGGRILLVGHGGVLRQLVADTLGSAPTAHAALEWPHAALSRVRVVDAPPHPRSQSLVLHAWQAIG